MEAAAAALRAHGAFVVADVQGLLRVRGPGGRIETRPAILKRTLGDVRAVKFSQREFRVFAGLPEPPAADGEWEVAAVALASELGAEILVSRGSEGAALAVSGAARIITVAAVSRDGSADSTGAGDILIAAYARARSAGVDSGAALERAVTHGDGWMGAGSSTVDDFRRQIVEIRALLDQQDRDPATFTLSKRLYVAIDDDADRAQRRLREWFGHNYGNPPMADAVSVWGPPAHVYEAIDGFIEAGAQHLLLNPVFDFDEHLEALARYVPGAAFSDSS